MQQIVLDLMAQLAREFSERSKVEALLRELLDTKRKSEQLSDEQLALFAALWQKRQTEREAENPAGEEDDDDGQSRPARCKHNLGQEARWPPGSAKPSQARAQRARSCPGEKHCARCGQDLRPIGEETCKRYEYVPASLTVIEKPV